MTEKKLRDYIIVKMLDYRDVENTNIGSFCKAEHFAFSSDLQRKRIFQKLKDDGFIETSIFLDDNGSFTITNKGIEYAEKLFAEKQKFKNLFKVTRAKSDEDIETNQSYKTQENNAKIVDNSVAACFNVEKLAECYVKLIDRACENEQNNVCLFGIFAPWGRGKTYFFKKIKEYINKRQDSESIHYDIIEFNAWKYQETPAIWAYLFETLYNSKDWWFKTRYQINRIYKSILRDAFLFLIPTMIMITILFFKSIKDFIYNNGLLSSTILTGLISIIGLILDFMSKHCFSAISLIKKYSKGISFARELGIQAEIEKEITSLLKFWISEKKTVEKKVILYIDDIDRCSETKMTSILDSLRTVLENAEIRKRLIIICSIDPDKIIKGIEYKYKALYDDNEIHSIAINQMDKIFLTGIALSPLDNDQLFEYASKLTEVKDNGINHNGQLANIIENTYIIIQKFNEQKRRYNSDLDFVGTEIYYQLKKLIMNYKKQLTPRKIRIIYYRILLANNIICNKEDSMITETLIKNIFNISVGNKTEESHKDDELSDILNMVVPYRYNEENEVSSEVRYKDGDVTINS